MLTPVFDKLFTYFISSILISLLFVFVLLLSTHHPSQASQADNEISTLDSVNTKTIDLVKVSSTAKKEKKLKGRNQLIVSYDKDILMLDNTPVKTGNLSSKYGFRKDPFNGKKRMHKGIDIAARKGTSIFPLGKGKVIFSGRKSGYGRVVEVQHGGNIISRYAHLKKSLVSKGQKVGSQDIIAQVGSSGRSTGPHLHLEVEIAGETVDPEIFLVGNLAKK